MKKQIKKIVCGVCLASMLTFAFTGVANAQTCTTFSCRIKSLISNYFSGESASSNNSIISIIKKYQTSIKPSDNNTTNNNGNTSNNNTTGSNGNNTSSNNNNTAPVDISSYANEMLRLVNEERTANGLAQLSWNAELAKVAQAKAQDMVNNNYFSHTSPTYGSPFEMMKSFGISYRYAAENIAKNASVEKAHVALMNSDGHRKNILNSNYTSIGIGIVKTSSNSYTIVQMFIG